MKRLLFTFIVLFLFQNLLAQNQYHETRILNESNPASYSISPDGNWAVAGLRKNTSNGITGAGEVEIFKRSGDTWQLYQTLHSPNPIENGEFGSIVKISYTTLIVSEVASADNNPGKVHTFLFNSEGSWVLVNTMDNLICRSIDLYEEEYSTGKYMGIGWYGADFSSNATTYYYSSSTNTWNQEANFTGGSGFARRVAITPNYFAVCNYSANVGSVINAGAVSLYQYGANGWSIIDTLISETPYTNQRYGYSLDLTQDYIAVGTYPVSQDSIDFVYLYNLNQGNPSLKKVLQTTVNPGTAHYGYSVALNGDRLLIGAPLQTHENAWNDNRGSAYLYKISEYNVFLEHEFYEPVTQPGGPEVYGLDVILNQDYLAIANSLVSEPENLYIYSGFGDNYLMTVGSPVLVPEIGDTAYVDIFIHLPEGESISSAELPVYLGLPTNVGQLVGFETEGTLVGDNNWISEFNQLAGVNIYHTAFAGATEISGYGKFVTLKIAVPNSTEDKPYSIRIDNSYGDIVFDDGNGYTLKRLNGILKIHHALVEDVDLNGTVQAYDASYILKYLAGSQSLNELQLFNADASANDTVSAFDASLVLMYKVGIIDVLPYTDPIPASGEILMQDIPIAANQIISLPINIVNGSNIYSFESKVNYDKNVLKFEGFESSENLSGFVVEVIEDSESISIFAASSSSEISEGSFFNLKFSLKEGLTDGSSVVEMSRLRFNENPEVENAGSSVLTIVTGIEDESKNLPKEFSLSQNYPNPFNPSTTIAYSLPEASNVNITIFNALGQIVESLVDASYSAGVYTYSWNASDMASGIYLVKISARGNKTGKNFVEIRKMMLLK